MDWLGPILSWPDCFSVGLYVVVGYLDDYWHLSMEFWNKVLFKNDKDTNKILWYEMHGYWHTLKYVCYSTACGKVLIFSWPAWIFHFFHATKLPNSHGFCVELVGNFLEKLEDGQAWCIKFAAFTWRLSSSRKFRAWNYRYLCVAGKVAWIMHESCMCLAWKVVFSTHVPASRVQRKLRTFPQAVL